MSKRFMNKDATKFGISDNGILTPRYRLGREQVNCLFRYLLAFIFQMPDFAESPQIADRMICLLYIHAIPCHSEQ